MENYLFFNQYIPHTIDINLGKKLDYKEINIIFFSDTHLGFDYPVRPRINIRRRGEDFFRNFEAVLSYTLYNKTDLIVHGGDLFFRSKVPEFIVDRVYQTLADFADRHIPMYIIPGNHERSQLPASLFLQHPYIRVFGQPRTFSLNIHDSLLVLAGFPFIRENIRRKFPRLLEQLNWTKQNADIKILIFHQAVEGATVGPGNFTFRNGPDVIPIFLLPHDASVFLCGHIHRRQVLKKTIIEMNRSIPVILSGSTERTSFAEMDEKKGFYHLIFDNKRGKTWRLRESRFLELPSRPMKDIFIESGISGQKFESYLKGKIEQIDQDSIIRLRSHGPITQDLADFMTTTNLNRLLPPGMNYKFSSNFFNSLF